MEGEEVEKHILTVVDTKIKRHIYIMFLSTVQGVCIARYHQSSIRKAIPTFLGKVEKLST